MIDAAKLDEIERSAERFRAAGMDSPLFAVPDDTYRALIAAAREAIALRALIEQHNAQCGSICAGEIALP